MARHVSSLAPLCESKFVSEFPIEGADRVEDKPKMLNEQSHERVGVASTIFIDDAHLHIINDGAKQSSLTPMKKGEATLSNEIEIG